MKNEIPASTANAPSAIPIAVELLSPLEPDVGVVETTGGAVVVVGIWDGEIGTPGENGFPCWPGGDGEIGALAAPLVVVCVELVAVVVEPPFEPAASVTAGDSKVAAATATVTITRRATNTALVSRFKNWMAVERH